MRTLLSGLLVLAMFILVIHVSHLHAEAHEPTLFQYVTNNYESDCHTTNAVTAILLNYRMYDTMFEVLILLTAIIGMKQFLPSPDELTPDHRWRKKG